VDSGALSAAENMAIDQRALDAMDAGETNSPAIRFFEWIEPSVTYGYLLDLEKVSKAFFESMSKGRTIFHCSYAVWRK
jgi:lipoate-protein ligase A